MFPHGAAMHQGKLVFAQVMAHLPLSTTIDLCLSVYPWAPFRSTKAAIKLHTLLDVRGSIPNFIHISDGKSHEVTVLDRLTPEPGAFYLLDRGFMDFGVARQSG